MIAFDTSERRILITGSHGLIGTALRQALKAHGFNVTGLDLQATAVEQGDVRDLERVRQAVGRGVNGIVHLAAVSRVAWGERDPSGCWATNVDGLQNILDVAQEQSTAPWVLFSSSREVYGQPDHMPVAEDVPLRPVNVYGRSKAEGERLIAEARNRGLSSAVVRFSNVYGSVDDHDDRVVPAFCRAAVAGESLRVDGMDCVFDFTYIDDAVRGVVSLVELLERGEAPPPVHLVTGRPTTLGELARLSSSCAGGTGTIVEAPSRTFDVHRFYGDPSRASAILDWRAEVELEGGLATFVEALRADSV